jgi:Na+-transporting methylmalonyl-CoA/oxaloacetate decarboxylase gamma subunit
MNDMAIALEITLLGMGLVFAAIILLWGMIKLLTFFTTEKSASSRPEPARPDLLGTTPTDEELRIRAAAVAVAIALAEQQASSAHPLRTPPTAIISAWQLGMRTRQMYQKGLPVRRQPSRQDDR